MTSTAKNASPPPSDGKETKQGFIPWADMWRTGLRLGLSPQAFWSLSFKEWRWLALPNDRASLSGQSLKVLMALFPDQQPKADNDSDILGERDSKGDTHADTTPADTYETKEITS